MANAATPVIVVRETMTIAEAIGKKNMVDLEDSIVRHLRLKI